MNAPLPRPLGFLYSPMFPLGPDRTMWKQLPVDGVRTATCDGQTVLRVSPDALRILQLVDGRRSWAEIATQLGGAMRLSTLLELAAVLIGHGIVERGQP